MREIKMSLKNQTNTSVMTKYKKEVDEAFLKDHFIFTHQKNRTTSGKMKNSSFLQ